MSLEPIIPGRYLTDRDTCVCHVVNFLIILGFIGLSITDCLFASPFTAIYLAKKNIKRKGILEEYEKVRRCCSIASPSFAVALALCY